MQGVQGVWSLVRKLRSHMPCGQKPIMNRLAKKFVQNISWKISNELFGQSTKKQKQYCNKFNRTLKMVHIQKIFKRSNSLGIYQYCIFPLKFCGIWRERWFSWGKRPLSSRWRSWTADVLGNSFITILGIPLPLLKDRFPWLQNLPFSFLLFPPAYWSKSSSSSLNVHVPETSHPCLPSSCTSDWQLGGIWMSRSEARAQLWRQCSLDFWL